MDSKGSMTIELAIVLIMIVLIIGVTMTALQNSTEKITKAEETQNIEKLIGEVADNLINNPGSPENWHEIKKGTPGLAIINEEGQIIPNSISWAKFCVLGENYKKLVDEKAFNSKIKTSMELIPQKSTISSVKIGSDDGAGNIHSVNRLVKCDFYKKYVIKDFQNGGTCNQIHHSQSDYSCNYFKVFPVNLDKSDYYLLIDKSQKYKLKYMIDTTLVQKDQPWYTTSSDKIYLNSGKIKFYGNDSAVVFIHFNKPNAKALLVSVPKSFDKKKISYDYFRTNDCRFILKAWY